MIQPEQKEIEKYRESLRALFDYVGGDLEEFLDLAAESIAYDVAYHCHNNDIVMKVWAASKERESKKNL